MNPVSAWIIGSKPRTVAATRRRKRQAGNVRLSGKGTAAGRKMVTAISEATVPKLCVVLRKAYGAGLYAMAGLYGLAHLTGAETCFPLT